MTSSGVDRWRLQDLSNDADDQPWHDCMASADQLVFKSERGPDLVQTDVQPEPNYCQFWDSIVGMGQSAQFY